MTIPYFNHRCLMLALASSLAAVTLCPLTGCQAKPVVGQKPVKKNYARQLADGESGLRKLAPGEIPPMGSLLAQFGDPAFRDSLQRSVAWYAKKSSPGAYAKKSQQGKFPAGQISTITFEKAAASAQAFDRIVRSAATPQEAERRIREQFDVYTSVGCDSESTVLFTAYHSPIYSASAEKTAAFAYPIYKRPADLPPGDEISRGWDASRMYPTRGELYDSGKLNGLELLYLPNMLDAYAIEVNGSAKLNMSDGSVKYVGFHGTNGRTYTSIGKLLVKDGKISADRISIQAIRAYFADHPGELMGYIRRNDRLPFFTEYPAESWPSGCLGFPVTAQRSLATDKLVFPPAAVAWVRTGENSETGKIKPIDQLMLDQDAGGAIRSPGRADLYLGTGPDAEKLAGQLAAEGRLYYFFLKDECMPQTAAAN